ncbi:hypothetical protein [Flavobacterium sp.]|uniref:DinB family protein n=1 Tax=Flavobacterium sp. TaxID=239 RepID=UPI0026302219|nr:hypothetical protein [Flavobacterium sp.]
MIQNLLITTSIRNWDEQNKRLLSLVNVLNEDQLEKHIAPGRNSGMYLLGHLTAINYNMISLFGLGENPQAELDTIFLINPDKTIPHNYRTDGLKELLIDSIQLLEEKVKVLTEADWLDRHSNVSAADFKLQPHRNKINVLINRTLHLAYHYGQFSLLK